MEQNELASRLIYKNGDTGLCLLSEFELSGNYPRWFCDYAVNQHNSHWNRPSVFKNVNVFVEGLMDDSSKIVFAVYAIKDAVHIGNVSLQSIDHMNQTAEIAFLFGEKNYWGKGYATDSANLIIEHAFKHLNLNRIYLGCLCKNTAMNKLALRLEFKEEGKRRQALFSEGEFHDVIEYGLLKNEFSTYSNC